MVTCDSYDFLAEIPVKSWSLCRLSSQFGIVDTQLSRDAPAAKFMLGHGARHGFQRCWETNKPGKKKTPAAPVLAFGVIKGGLLESPPMQFDDLPIEREDSRASGMFQPRFTTRG